MYNTITNKDGVSYITSREARAVLMDISGWTNNSVCTKLKQEVDAGNVKKIGQGHLFFFELESFDRYRQKVAQLIKDRGGKNIKRFKQNKVVTKPIEKEAIKINIDSIKPEYRSLILEISKNLKLNYNDAIIYCANKFIESKYSIFLESLINA